RSDTSRSPLAQAGSGAVSLLSPVLPQRLAPPGYMPPSTRDEGLIPVRLGCCDDLEEDVPADELPYDPSDPPATPPAGACIVPIAAVQNRYHLTDGDDEVVGYCD